MCARNVCRREVRERCPCKSVVGEGSVCVKAWCVEVVCGEDSCVKVLWVKERYGTGVDVKALRVQVLRGQVCVSKNCM